MFSARVVVLLLNMQPITRERKKREQKEHANRRESEREKRDVDS